jgi:hypothetical protein
MWLKRIQILTLLLVGPSIASCGNYNTQPGIPFLLIYEDLITIINPAIPGVNINHSGTTGSVTEGATTDSYTIVLNSQPEADIVVQATPDSQLLVNGISTATSLTFTQDNWDTLQTLTVSAVDDALAEGSHTGTISHAVSQGDELYLALTSLDDLTFSITDNDTPGVSITESGGATNITEGGATDTYTIVLTSAPTANVVISMNPDTQSTTDLPSITFTNLDWNSPQTITVTAVNDDVAEGNHSSTISHTASSTDANYNGISINDVVASITDNETAGVSISPTSVSVSEAGTSDTYDIVLTSKPAGSVTVGIADDSQVNVDTSSVVFSTTDWNSPQTVTVSAEDDGVAEGTPHYGTITHTATSVGDPAYNGVGVSDVTASITDNDTAAVIITESLGSTDVEEGSGTTSDTYTISLQTTPSGSADVNVDVAFNIGQVTIDGKSSTPQTIVLDAGNSWTATITVEAVDDSSCEQNHISTISHTATSAASEYNGIGISDVTVNIADTARVNYKETGTVSMAGSASQNITLGQSVDTARTFTLCNFITTSSSETSWVTCELNSGSVLNVSTGATVPATVRYHVVEFQTGVNVQRGSVSWNTAQATQVVTLPSAVDTGSSFAIVNARTTDTLYDKDERATVTAEITGPTSLTLTRNEALTAIEIEWQVVEIEAATVQSGTTQIAGGANTKTLTAPADFTSVDTSTTFLLFSYRAAGASNGIESLYKTRGMITDGSTVTFNRASTSNTVDIAWYLVTMTDGATVQSGTENFAGTAGTNISRTVTIIPSVDTTCSLPVISSSGGIGVNDDLDASSFTGFLSSGSGLQLDRGSDQNVTSNVDWFVIEFLK